MEEYYSSQQLQYNDQLDLYRTYIYSGLKKPVYRDLTYKDVYKYMELKTNCNDGYVEHHYDDQYKEYDLINKYKHHSYIKLYKRDHLNIK